MDRFRFGIVSKTATYWPHYVGLREGLFEAQGLDLEIVLLGSTAAGVPALLEDRVDVAGTCPDILIVHASKGAALRVAGGIINKPVSSVISVPDVASFAELRGRRVAVTEPRGSVSIFLKAVLRRNSLADGDYEAVVCSTTPLQVEALEKGDVDAAMLTHPFEERLLRKGFHRLARVGDVLGTGAFTTLNVRQGWTARPEWPRFQAALRECDRVLRDPAHKQTSLAALADWTGVPAEEQDEAYRLYTGDPDVLAHAGEVDVAGLGRLLTFMAEDGIEVQGTARDFLDEHAAVV
jgi:ABC-type nitrate/sulfonate/bicarbonate transport system substrate-binding protein